MTKTNKTLESMMESPETYMPFVHTVCKTLTIRAAAMAVMSVLSWASAMGVVWYIVLTGFSWWLFSVIVFFAFLGASSMSQIVFKGGMS